MEKMQHSLFLDGEWLLRWNPLTGKEVKNTLDKSAPITCSVPGDVHCALIENGLIEEPSIGLNSQECTWIEDQEFWYSKEFFIEPNFIRDSCVLTFDGLDLTADIWLNDLYLGGHNNAFISVDFDITSALVSGKNTLIVRIDQGLAAVKDKPLGEMGCMWNNDQPYRAWMRKPQYVYGWDWTVWLPSCGIWKSVYITSYKTAHINEIYVYDSFPSESLDVLLSTDKPFSTSLHCDITLEFFDSYDDELYLNYQITTDPRFDNLHIIAKSEKIRVIHTTSSPLLSLTLEALTLNDPKLWWPNLSGDPYLYTVEFVLTNVQGDIIDSKQLRHGIRKTGIREEQLNDKERGFTFIINDTPIFCKGANHVPLDCLPGRVTLDKTRKVLAMATECHMNMIRVWGGGVYATDEFLDQCDENGLMVWHDFMFACGYHPDHDPDFYHGIEVEATQVIKRMRNHASLIGWSGNNEVQDMYFSTKQWRPELPWYGATIYEILLPSLVEANCVNTIYRESSPFGERGVISDFDCGDQHIWHFTHRPDYEHFMDLVRFVDFPIKFLSEFGIIGAMNMTSAKKCISQEAFYPDSDEWLFHSNNSLSHTLLHRVVETYFGDYTQFSPENFILRSQLIQAELIRIIYDEFQRRKFECSGLLFWTLSDSIGIHNWAIIDYYLEKRPIYYYLKRTMEPLKIAFSGYQVQNFDGMANYSTYFATNPCELSIWIINDYLVSQSVVLDYYFMDFHGNILESKSLIVNATANSSIHCYSIDVSNIDFSPEETLVYATLTQDNQLLHENKYLFAPFKAVTCFESTLKVQVTHLEDGRTQLMLNSSVFVWMLHVEIEASDKNGEHIISEQHGQDIFSDNDFDVYPTKTKYLYVSYNLTDLSHLRWKSMNSIRIIYQ